MAKTGTHEFLFHEVQFHARFIQGYRFLDRCGETLVRLEEVLDEGWIPAEVAPKSGVMKNDAAGMVVTFNSEGVTVAQHEYIDAPGVMFRDQVKKIFSVVRETLKVERINVPTFRAVLQMGFEADDIDAANKQLLSWNLCKVAPEAASIVGGDKEALDFVMITGAETQWQGEVTRQRRRMAMQVVRQERRPGFDERLLRRVRLLGMREQQAVAAMMALRKQMPAIPPVAIQFDFEHCFEQEFVAKAFDLPIFLDTYWAWATDAKVGLDKLKPPRA